MRSIGEKHPLTFLFLLVLVVIFCIALVRIIELHRQMATQEIHLLSKNIELETKNLEIIALKIQLKKTEEIIIQHLLRPPNKSQITKPNRIWKSISHKIIKDKLFLPITNYIKSVNPKAPAESIAQAVLACSFENQINPIYVLAVAEQESHFRPNVTGEAGERGIMQLMHNTAIHLNIPWERAFEIELNICGASKLLARYLEQTPDWRYALTRYNGSPVYAERVINQCQTLWKSIATNYQENL